MQFQTKQITKPNGKYPLYNKQHNDKNIILLICEPKLNISTGANKNKTGTN